MLIYIWDSISSVDSFCSVTPFALANLGIFLQSGEMLHFLVCKSGLILGQFSRLKSLTYTQVYTVGTT